MPRCVKHDRVFFHGRWQYFTSQAIMALYQLDKPHFVEVECDECLATK